MIAWLRQQALPLLRQAAAEWQTDQGPWLAAGTSYYAALSLFPLLLFLMTVLGAFLRLSPGARGAEQELLQLIAVNGSPGIALQVQELLAEVKFQGGVSGPIALATLLFSATGVFAALDVAFDRLWRVPPPTDQGVLAVVRRILGQRLAAFAMLLGAGALLGVAFLAGLALTAAAPLLRDLPGASLGLAALRIGLGFVVEVSVFALLYKVLPKPRVPWGAAWLGALPTALAWELGKQVLALVVTGGNYNAYGVVGAFLALMVWIYYASNVFFFGAKLVQLICSRAAQAAHEAALPQPAPTTT